eukprot:TRINITY_DN4502_c0_g5_i1.p1 TRINITY_DN4502_c0_g5~~TRINITY_DN4502_c0_g5_i1.p1  ORF type:complete len:202 (-),score=52.48 TRINITY_DN4502_c0_g5_i1:647-1252(-)
MVSIPVLNIWDWNFKGQLILTLFVVGFIGLGSALLVGTGFGVVASLPPHYTTAVMTGQGIAGLLAALLQLVMDFAIFGSEPNSAQIEAEGMIYFGTAGIFILFCTVSTALLVNSRFFLWYERLQTLPVSINDLDGGDSGFGGDGGGGSDDGVGSDDFVEVFGGGGGNSVIDGGQSSDFGGNGGVSMQSPSKLRMIDHDYYW